MAVDAKTLQKLKRQIDKFAEEKTLCHQGVLMEWNLVWKLLELKKIYHFMLSKRVLIECFLPVTVAEKISHFVGGSLYVVAHLFAWKQKTNKQKPWLFSLHRISAFELPAHLSVKQKYVHKTRKLFLSISISFVFEVQMGKYSSALRPDLKTVV